MQVKPITILGAILVVWGVNIALSAIFPISIPVFALLFAAGLIYLGYRVIQHQSVFSERLSAGRAARKYCVFFGRQTIDLRTLQLPAQDPLIHIDCVFGETLIVVDPSAAVTARIHAVFAEGRTPDDNLVVFGTLNYSTRDEGGFEFKKVNLTQPLGRPEGGGGPSPQDRRVFIEANVVFGSVKIVMA